jgi:hypothetical protein
MSHVDAGGPTTQRRRDSQSESLAHEGPGDRLTRSGRRLRMSARRLMMLKRTAALDAGDASDASDSAADP